MNRNPQNLAPSGVVVLGVGVSMLGRIAVAGRCGAATQRAGVAGGRNAYPADSQEHPAEPAMRKPSEKDPEFRSERRHRAGLVHPCGLGIPSFGELPPERCCLTAGRLTMVCGIV